MKNMNIEAQIEALYQNQRTNKFIKHLIKAFCNTNYLKFDVMGEDCITKEYGETCVKSMLSDKVLDSYNHVTLLDSGFLSGAALGETTYVSALEYFHFLFLSVRHVLRVLYQYA